MYTSLLEIQRLLLVSNVANLTHLVTSPWSTCLFVVREQTNKENREFKARVNEQAVSPKRRKRQALNEPYVSRVNMEEVQTAAT